MNTLQQLEANSVDSIVTDPPYGLGFMGKEWDNLPPGREVFEQCLRVLKPGGHLCCFGGSRTYHRMAVAVEDAGFEIRDQIMWVYGSGSPKSQDIGKAVDKIQGNERELVNVIKGGQPAISQDRKYPPIREGNQTNGRIDQKITKGHSEWEGYGTALKPAHEPIVLARKPVEKGLNIAQNCLKWGVGAINIDGCRVETNEKIETTQGQSDAQQNGQMYSGKDQRDKAAFNQHPQGRFPANFIHDCSDQVVGLFPVTSSGKESINGHKRDKSLNYKSNINYAPRTKDAGNLVGDKGSAARFFYCAKATKKERGEYNNHPTVKPIKLMQYLVKLITPEGGTCLDPFAGSGTTGLACMKEGRSHILIDSDSQSLEIARRRLLSEVVSAHWGQPKKSAINKKPLKKLLYVDKPC